MTPVQHYYLASAEVTFVDSEGKTGITRVATVFATDFPRIGAKELTDVQRASQLTLFNSLGEQVNVVNVVIMNISPLGMMTEEEFSAMPQAPDAPAAAEAAPVADTTEGVDSNDGLFEQRV